MSCGAIRIYCQIHRHSGIVIYHIGSRTGSHRFSKFTNEVQRQGIGYGVATGTRYQRLRIVGRCEIARLWTAGCSVPEIAAVLDRASSAIPHESIYRFIYAQQARAKDYSWRLYLPRGQSKRGWRGGNAIVPIPGGTPPLIPTQSGRSPEADDRRTISVQQYDPAAPGLPDAGRSIRRRVALEM